MTGTWEMGPGRREERAAGRHKNHVNLEPGPRQPAQRGIAVGAAVFEEPAVALASNAGAPAAAPLASYQ